MKEIRNEKFICFDLNKSIVRANIQVDTVDELPEVTDFSRKILAMGSIAWVIGTGDFYALNSSGKWVNQSTGETVGNISEQETDKSSENTNNENDESE